MRQLLTAAIWWLIALLSILIIFNLVIEPAAIKQTVITLPEETIQVVVIPYNEQ